MRISEICIKRPVLSWVMTLIIIVLGLVGFSRLGIQYLPNIERSVVTIESHLAGASGSVVEQTITRPIEEAIGGIDGIDFVQSNSSLGDSKITVTFLPTKNLDRGVDEIRDRLSRIQDLPKEMPPPSVIRMGGNANYIMSLALRHDQDDPKRLGELAEFAKNEIEKEFESIKGVAQIITSGGGLYRMYIYLDPSKLAVNNVSVREVINSIHRHNFEDSAGQLKTQEREYTVTVVANLEKPVQFEEMPVLEREGRIIKIKDLGRVEMLSEDKASLSRFNGQRVVRIGILKQSLSNPMDIAQAVKKKLPEIRTKLKSDMKLDIAYDGTRFIDVSVKHVYRTIFEAILFVTLVVLFFLASVRASFIPLVTIPVSLIGTFFFIYLLGFTINMFSLAAIILAVGLVVDDAIVVLENTYRYLEKGLKPFDAATKSINEIGFSVVAMTLTLASVYAPTALAQGFTGKLMIEFALTLAISVLISGFVALTLSPMMCARMLTSQKLTKYEKILIDWLHNTVKVEERLNKLDELYEKYLTKVIKIKKKAIIAVCIFGACCFILYRYIPQTLLPTEDQNTILIAGEAPQSATLEFTDRYVKILDERLAAIPEIEKREVTIENINRYKINITLRDNKRKKTTEVVKDIAKIYDTIAGINARVSSDEASDMVQFCVRGNKDVGQLYNYVMQLNTQLANTGFFQQSGGGILTSQRNLQEEFLVLIDEKVDALKINPKDVSEVIRGLMKGEKSTTFKKDNRRYDVMVGVDKSFQQTMDDYLKIYYTKNVRNEDIRIPLGELIKIEPKLGYPNVQHYKGTRMVDAMYKLKPGVGVKECVNRINEFKKQILPDDVYLDFIGETKKFNEESNAFVFIFLLALCFIYLVLAAQFESWRDPLIIMLSVPLSLAGGILGLLIFFSDPQLTMWGNIGFITLIGLITKHGIMMVDFANTLMAEKYTATNAIIHACKIRLRPILMTTSAMILGSIPLLLIHGPTQKANNELGAVIVGGLMVGTLLTLFFIPCVYVYFKQEKKLKAVNN